MSTFSGEAHRIDYSDENPLEAHVDLTINRKTKWFWLWQDDIEEAWLEQMSQLGLHLKKAQIMAQYDFIQGQPEDFAYRLDFRDSLKRKNKEEYIHLFNDAGWEYLGEMGGWQYFRKPAQPGDDKEIFTDPNTIVSAKSG